MIDAIQHRIDQGLAVELTIAAITLNRVISGFDATFIVTMQAGEQRQAFGVSVITHPGIQHDHISNFQHRLLQHTNRAQSLDQQTIEAIHSRESGGNGTGFIGARQSAIAGDPTLNLIQATTAAAGWCLQIRRGGADRAGHGGGRDQGERVRREDATAGRRRVKFSSSRGRLQDTQASSTPNGPDGSGRAYGDAPAVFCSDRSEPRTSAAMLMKRLQNSEQSNHRFNAFSP